MRYCGRGQLPNGQGTQCFFCSQFVAAETATEYFAFHQEANGESSSMGLAWASLSHLSLLDHCAGCRQEDRGDDEEEGHRALRHQDAVRRPRRDLRQEQDVPPGGREGHLGLHQEEQAQQGPHHHAGREAEEGLARQLVRRLPHSQLRSPKVISRKRSSEAWCLQVRLFRIEAFAYVRRPS